MVIGLVGPKLSGKGTAAHYLENEHGASTFRMSGILSDIAQRLHLQNTRANLIAIATGLRSQFGADILATVLKKDVEKSHTPIAVIDGIRFADEVKLFSTLTDFRLVYIDAPVEVRYERAKKRGEKVEESTMSFEQFSQEEHAVTETGIEQLKGEAQGRIINATTFRELYAQIDRIVKE